MKGPLITLQEATHADIPALIEIEQSVAGNRIYSPSATAEEWEEEFTKSHIFLVKNDSTVVGDISYEVKDSNHVYISGLAIAAQWQQKGYARAALALVVEKIGPVHRIDLVTHPENTVAIKLYESFGFKIESRIENFYGDGEPRIIMALERI